MPKPPIQVGSYNLILGRSFKIPGQDQPVTLGTGAVIFIHSVDNDENKVLCKIGSQIAWMDSSIMEWLEKR